MRWAVWLCLGGDAGLGKQNRTQEPTGWLFKCSLDSQLTLLNLGGRGLMDKIRQRNPLLILLMGYFFEYE